MPRNKDIKESISYWFRSNRNRTGKQNLTMPEHRHAVH